MTLRPLFYLKPTIQLSLPWKRVQSKSRKGEFSFINRYTMGKLTPKEMERIGECMGQPLVTPEVRTETKTEESKE